MMHVFVGDNKVFSSPNSRTLPCVPTTPLDISVPSAARIPGWSSNTFPQLGYIPLSPRLHGPIFERLALSNTSFEKINGLWQLSPPTLQAWCHLEMELIYAAGTLCDRAAADFGFSLDYSFPPYPSRWGFMRSHRHKHQARACALRSRDAFMILVGYCSFAISLHGNDFDADAPKWMKLLVDSGVHPVWVEHLRQSPVGEFSDFNTRVGVFFHVGECNWPQLVPSLLHAHVPVWFYWGEVDNIFTPKSPFTKPYYPNSDQIAVAFTRLPTHSPGVVQVEPLVSGTPLHRSDHSLPPLELHHSTEPHPGSRQRKGESWQQFFSRQAVRHAQYMERESAANKQSRLQRINSYRNCPEPGRRGPMVYRWEDAGGFRVRTPMNRGAVCDWWGEYSNTQKVYNSVDNEWDVCTDFDPDGEIDDDDSEFDDIDIRPQTPPAPPYTPLPPSPSLWRKDLSTVYDPDIAPASDHLYSDNESLESLLYHRFGFLLPLRVEASTASSSPSLAWQDVLKVVGMTQSNLDDHYKNDVRRFLGCLLSGEVVPESLYDLNDSSQFPLHRMVNQLVQVATKNTSNGKTFYVIEPLHSNTNTCWELVVQDAATVLECIRREWGPYCDDIARHFAQRGIAFSTRVPPSRDSAVCPQPCRSLVGLGWRYPDYKPDVVDYAAYESTRDAFFRQPHARAALLKGGIIWRLAKEHFGLDYDAVIAGPSDNVYDNGLFLHFSDGQISLDDDLSEAELDLICGVYKVYTGQGHSGQTSDMSWWPKHSAWRGSGLNVGWWTPDCEIWFQTRLNSIRSSSGTTLLKNGAQWKRAMHFNKKSAKLSVANQNAAAKYLAESHRF